MDTWNHTIGNIILCSTPPLLLRGLGQIYRRRVRNRLSFTLLAWGPRGIAMWRWSTHTRSRLWVNRLQLYGKLRATLHFLAVARSRAAARYALRQSALASRGLVFAPNAENCQYHVRCIPRGGFAATYCKLYSLGHSHRGPTGLTGCSPEDRKRRPYLVAKSVRAISRPRLRVGARGPTTTTPRFHG